MSFPKHFFQPLFQLMTYLHDSISPKFYSVPMTGGLGYATELEFVPILAKLSASDSTFTIWRQPSQSHLRWRCQRCFRRCQCFQCCPYCLRWQSSSHRCWWISVICNTLGSRNFRDDCWFVGHLWLTHKIQNCCWFNEPMTNCKTGTISWLSSNLEEVKFFRSFRELQFVLYCLQ